MKDYNNKNKELKEELLKNNQSLTYSYLIIRLLNKGNINSLIEKITDTKTKVNVTTIIQKEYLSGNEQFLYLLNHFIYEFKESFYFLQNGFENIIEILLQNEKYTKFLLSKKYIGNNDNILYFSTNIKRLITSGFYNNIKKLSKKSELIRKFIKDNNISSRRTPFNNIKDLDNLYETLIKLTMCNAKNQKNIFLFEDIKHYTNSIVKDNKKENIKNTIYNYYLTEWEFMIKNYYEKIDAINILLK